MKMIKTVNVEFTLNNAKFINKTEVLEIPPQKRLLNIRVGKSIELMYNSIQLPYLYAIINYTQKENKEICFWGGQPLRSFHIFGSDKTITEDNQEVSVIPFETKFNGLVCTNHEYDSYTFKNRDELVNWALSEWYGLTHWWDSTICHEGSFIETAGDVKLESYNTSRKENIANIIHSYFDKDHCFDNKQNMISIIELMMKKLNKINYCSIKYNASEILEELIEKKISLESYICSTYKDLFKPYIIDNVMHRIKYKLNYFGD